MHVVCVLSIVFHIVFSVSRSSGEVLVFACKIRIPLHLPLFVGLTLPCTPSLLTLKQMQVLK